MAGHHVTMTSEALLPVASLTGDDVITAEPDATLVHIADILAAQDVGVVVLGSPQQVTGIVSERDVVRAVADRRDLASTRASEVARTDLVWADGATPVAEVAAEMLEEWVRHVLISDGGHLVGVVSVRDMLGALAQDAGTD